MNKIWIAALALCGLLAGCAMGASTPISFADSKPVPQDRLFAHYKPEPGTLPVQIKSDPQFISSSMYELDIDGKKSADIDGGEKLTFYLTPGQHVMTMSHVNDGTNPMEFPLYVDSKRPNLFRFYDSEGRKTHFSPTATD